MNIAPGLRRASERPVSTRSRKWRSAALARLKTIVAACLALFLASGQPAFAELPQFSGQIEPTSDTGHVLLSWRSEEPVSLRIATKPDFSDGREVYAGGAHSFFLSGLGNGTYFLRLEASNGEISEPFRLSVTHQSLQRALWLVVVGALITLAVTLVILRGARDE